MLLPPTPAADKIICRARPNPRTYFRAWGCFNILAPIGTLIRVSVFYFLTLVNQGRFVEVSKAYCGARVHGLIFLGLPYIDAY